MGFESFHKYQTNMMFFVIIRATVWTSRRAMYSLPYLVQTSSPLYLLLCLAVATQNDLVSSPMLLFFHTFTHANPSARITLPGSPSRPKPSSPSRLQAYDLQCSVVDSGRGVNLILCLHLTLVLACVWVGGCGCVCPSQSYP